MAVMGHPRIIKTAEDLHQLYIGYLDYCEANERMPNIAGLCTYISREIGQVFFRQRFYDYAKKNDFADTIKTIDDSLEDAVLNDKNQLPLIRMAYLNNKCGYKSEQDFKLKVETVVDPDQLRGELQNLLSGLSPEERLQLTSGNIIESE